MWYKFGLFVIGWDNDVALLWWICRVEACESYVPALEPLCSPSEPWAPGTAELLPPELKQINSILEIHAHNCFIEINHNSRIKSWIIITFLEGFVDIDLTRDKVFVIFNVGEDAALVDPVVVMRPEEEDREVTNVVAQALNVGWHQARIADLSRPPPARKWDRNIVQ